jgi:hypothetical protein
MAKISQKHATDVWQGKLDASLITPHAWGGIAKWMSVDTILREHELFNGYKNHAAMINFARNTTATVVLVVVT